MVETFLLLLTGHLLGDFVFQTDALIRQKVKPRGVALHTAIVGAITVLVLAPTLWSAVAALLIVLVTHFVMDFIKARWLGPQLWAFTLDQAVHLLVIAALAVLWPEMARQSLWGHWPSDIQGSVYAGFALICGMTVGVSVGGVVIKMIVEPLSPAQAAAASGVIIGMKNAGRYIGWLERALAIIFILIKHPEGVGLLLAAKSILRFRDVQDEKDRHQAEYIIIGTFLSFGWAIVTALATGAAMAHWLAP